MVVLAELEVPVFLLGLATSKGEAVFAPFTAKATTDEAAFPLRLTVIVILPAVVCKAQNVCKVLLPVIATLILAVDQLNPPPEIDAVCEDPVETAT